jgi:PAS domain S-box-containing protein
MDWLLTSTLLLSLTAAALSTGLAYYAWSRRPATGSTLFTLIMLAMAQWALAYALEVGSSTLTTRIIWAKFQFLGAVILPVAWLIFVLEFTGNETWITRRNVLLLSLLPGLTLLLAVSNESHGLIWQQTSLGFSASSRPILAVSFGLWFWIHMLFTYGCLLMATFILFAKWRQEGVSLYRWQTLSLLIGLLLPWVGNTPRMMGISDPDLPAFIHLFSGAALAYYALRFRLFDIAPVAHRAIVNSMQDGALVLDTQNRIADANPAAQHLINRPLAELIGKPIMLIWPNLVAITTTEPEEPIEMELGRPEAPIYYEVTISPLYDWRDEFRGHLLILHDITRQKELDQMREAVVHTMIHDLRDPLSNSLFALEMLRGDMIDINLPEGDQLLELTFAQTKKTLNLVDMILEISRLKNGIEMVLNQTAIPMAEFIEKAIRAQTPRIIDKDLRLTCHVSDSLPPAWGDASLIERVLQNLLDNSIKFSPRGGVIRIVARLVGSLGPRESARLQVSVSDQGPGISNELQKRIFEQFVAGPVKGSGTGLGLAFCKMAMMAHGEHIWVESQPGAGSRFVFSLPVALEPARVKPPI